jgi:uncharacterized DUF497 family protein
LSAPSLDVAWDPAEAQFNLAKHSVSFAQAATVLLDALALTVYDGRAPPGRGALVHAGHGKQRKLLAVSHTYQVSSPLQGKVRVISAREASPRERQHYEDEPR